MMQQLWLLKTTWTKTGGPGPGVGAGWAAHEYVKGEYINARTKAKELWSKKILSPYVANVKVCWEGMTTKESGCYDGSATGETIPGYDLAPSSSTPRIYQRNQPTPNVTVAPTLPKPRIAWLPKTINVKAQVIEYPTVRGPGSLGETSSEERNTSGWLWLGAGLVVLGYVLVKHGSEIGGGLDDNPRRRGPRYGEQAAMRAYRKYIEEELNRGADAEIVSFTEFLASGGTGSDDYGRRGPPRVPKLSAAEERVRQAKRWPVPFDQR